MISLFWFLDGNYWNNYHYYTKHDSKILAIKRLVIHVITYAFASMINGLFQVAYSW